MNLIPLLKKSAISSNHSLFRRLRLFLLCVLFLTGCGRNSTSNLDSLHAAPKGILAVSSGDGKITISWEPVSGAESNNVYLASSPGVTKENFSTLPDGAKYEKVSSSMTISNLANPQKDYYFVATSTKNNVESPESDEVSALWFKTVENGAYHTCIPRANGTVKCWGNNLFGQLGNGTITHSSTPVVVNGISNALSVANGEGHSCALLSDGSIKCWGANGSGQLGNGNTTDASLPVGVDGITNAISVAAHGAMSCAVLSDNTVRCWGRGASNELVNGNPSDASAPVMVNGISNALSVAAGGAHRCALLLVRTVRCWGANNVGQLGNGEDPNLSLSPVAVTGLSSVVEIAAGIDHTCALLSDGTIRCWGWDFSGQLGNDTLSVFASLPVNVEGIVSAISVAAAGDRSCAVLSEGTVWCWGKGPLGNGTTTNSFSPVQVFGITTATDLFMGDSHACAVVTSGDVQCWGANNWGELGNGETSISSTPQVVKGIFNATAIAAGPRHNCVVASSGSILCWGDNRFGQLGNGSLIDSPTPVLVQGISNAVSVATGGDFYNFGDYTCALLSSGIVKCWGSDTSGQLGDGTIGNPSNIPVTVSGISSAISIAAFTTHACAELSNQTIKCWGLNSPQEPLPSIFDTSTMISGGRHTCTLEADGSIQCWGENWAGQAGVAPESLETLSIRQPVTVPGITGAEEASANWEHTCARLSGGMVKCWGNNFFGQLGNGVGGFPYLPVTVTGL